MAVRARVHGFTLIELLVAMAIGLIVVLAAAAALMVSRSGFTTVDAASQMRDNARFAADLIQRISVQAGYRDTYFAAQAVTTGGPARTPDITGYDNSKIVLQTPPTAPTSSARVSTEVGYGSDVLILSYQAARMYPGVKPDGTPNVQADQSMIDCAGNAPATVPDFTASTAVDTRITSIFHVDIDQGEPSLMCTYLDATTNTWTTTPIVQGVENFQVLYGVDGVVTGTDPAVNAPKPEIPLTYLRADQMNGATTAGTAANWTRVRALRIGMVLRSAPNSTQDSQPQTFYPFGSTPDSSGGAKGSAFASTTDVNTIFAPTPDGRLRQVATFTIHLRNDQGL